jgi:hypothetical protein
MKPTANQFPKTDFNYHSVEVDGFKGHCATRSTNYWRFSRDYFANEARHNFLTEAATFAAMIAMGAVPVVSVVYAIKALWTFGAF